MLYKKLLTYPHLKPEEIAIWERFITKYPAQFSEVFYDVVVGEGAKVPEIQEENFRRDIRYLSAKKIDVVGKTYSDIWIIELRKRAGIEIVGKLMSYVQLYKEKFMPVENVVGVLVTDEEMPDIRNLCQNFGVLLFIV